MQHPLPVRIGHLGQRDLLGEAGTVDQHRDRPERCLGPVDQRADGGAVGHVLEHLAKVSISRLVDESVYGPMEMRAVLDLTGQIQWAALEAIRVLPLEFDHLEA